MADSESGGRGLVAHDIANATNTPFDTGSEADAYARWSKADNALVFESSRDGNPEIYRHEIDAGTTTRLTDNGELDEWPSPSPDGNWIAWASGSEEVKDLWIMRSDGTEKRQLSDGVLFGDAFAEWSPDGAEILLSARDDEGSALFLVNLASGEMRRVTAGSAAAWR
jgi:TolB protein